MNKTQKIILSIVCVILAGVTIYLGYYMIQFLRLFGWFYDGDIDLQGVGIGGYFEYDKKEKLISISTFTGKSEYLYKYYYSEDKEEELLNRIIANNTWNKIEREDEPEFYRLKGLIEPVSQGYFFYYNYDHYNEVYDAYDMERNYELGGHASQFYVITIVDTERNIIWYFNTERIERRCNDE